MRLESIEIQCTDFFGVLMSGYSCITKLSLIHI